MKILSYRELRVYRSAIDLAMEIFRLMGINRDDKGARNAWMSRSFYFFHAPCQIVICVDKEMLDRTDMIAIGAICQSICLAALNYDLGTCIADLSIMYDHVWHKYASIPETKRLVAGISIGYPDWNFPANKLVTLREPVDSVTTWLGY